MGRKSSWLFIVVLIVILFAAFIWPTRYRYIGEVHLFGKIPALARQNRLTGELQYLSLVPKLFGRWRTLPQENARAGGITIALYDSLLPQFQYHDRPVRETGGRVDYYFELSPADRENLIESFHRHRRDR